MVVTCLLGMRIPVGPVSKRNPALCLRLSRHKCHSSIDALQLSTTAGLGLGETAEAAVPTWFVKN